MTRPALPVHHSDPVKPDYQPGDEVQLFVASRSPARIQHRHRQPQERAA